MGLFERFFGHGKSKRHELRANPAPEEKPALQILFDRQRPFTAEQLVLSLRAWDRELVKATVEINPEAAKAGVAVGLIGWSNHVIQILAFDHPMPSDPVEACLAPSHYAQELKDAARAHVAHALLWYAGRDESTHEQYVALAAVAGALADLGAIVVLNETAHTSLPASVLKADAAPGEMMKLLRELPLLLLFCGFVKHEVEGVAGVWMRTYGCPMFALPDLALHASGHHEGQQTFDTFTSVLAYLRSSGATLEPGHTMQVGDDSYFKVRAPRDDEPFLTHFPGELLVAEIISKSQINR